MMGIRKRSAQVAVLIASLTFAAACGDDDEPFAPPVPAELSIVDGSGQEGPVSFPLEQQLRVKVTSDDGAGMPNIPVTWAITGGGTLNDSSTLTNSAGESVVSWTLGPAAGPQTVTATAPGLAPVTFTATATPFGPLFLLQNAGNNQSGFSLEPLSATSVVLLGSDRAPIAGATITWTVLTGGGSVSPATSVTNAQGVASTTWTLGPAQGEQTLQARAGDQVAVFSAFVANPCTSARPFSAITAANRALTTGDCVLPSGPLAGSFVEYFNYAPTTAQAAVYTMSSTAFDTHLTLLRGNDTVAVDDTSGAGTDAAITIFLGPGSYRFANAAAVAGAGGAYTFAQTAAPAVTNCDLPWLSRGASTAQAITTTDCLAGGYYSDEYRIYIKAGETVTFRQTGAATTKYIIVFDEDFNIIEEGGSSTVGATAVVAVTPTVSAWYIIDVGTWNTNETGAYTITVDP